VEEEESVARMGNMPFDAMDALAPGSVREVAARGMGAIDIFRRVRPYSQKPPLPIKLLSWLRTV